MSKKTLANYDIFINHNPAARSDKPKLFRHLIESSSKAVAFGTSNCLACRYRKNVESSKARNGGGGVSIRGIKE